MALLCLLGVPGGVPAAGITLPLTVRFELLTQKLSQELYTAPGGIAPIWHESVCRYLSLDRPQFSHQGGRLRFTTHGTGSFGAKVLETCLSPLSWQGFIELLIEPYITPEWQLRLRIVDSNVYDEDWQKGLFTGLLWEVTERLFFPRLTALLVDLAPPRDEVLSLIRVSVPGSATAQIEAILNSALPKAVEVRDTGVVVLLALTVPDPLMQAPPSPTPPEPPLTAAELETYQQALERWDAFLVFVIKGFGEDLVDPQIREELFDLLMTNRYELLPVLAGEVTRDRGDPVRRLFIETWKRLHTIVEEGEQRGLLGDKLLRYIGFIGAGDALLALEQAAPGLGIQISVDGLRRLARMLRPEVTEDPLIYRIDVDPALRALFGFPPEIPAEPLPELPAEPPPAPSPEGFFQWPLPQARAAEADDEPLTTLKKRLDRWVPERSELPEYGQLVEQLLGQSTGRALEGNSLETHYVAVYRHLVPATALKESCWRQFERKQKKITYTTSSAGSIGLMQINPRVWRGFYDVEQLKWNTAYNARAGAEILMQYLQRYGIKEGNQTGTPENAARATYAVYNAGPRAVDRYRARDSSKRETKVDAKFWELYRGFAANGEVDLYECTVEAG